MTYNYNKADKRNLLSVTIRFRVDDCVGIILEKWVSYSQRYLPLALTNANPTNPNRKSTETFYQEAERT